MAQFGFRFTNDNDGQTIVVNDTLDTSANPIFNGAVNHGANSPTIYCWVGDGGKGVVTIKGEHSILSTFDITQDGQTVDYS